MPEKQLDSVKKQFINYLDSLGLSPKTHKNYRSDLTHFLAWAILKVKSFGAYAETLTEIVPFLTLDLANDYKDFMLENSTPAKTINRRLSTLRHLSKFLLQSHVLDFDFTGEIDNIGKKIVRVSSPDPVIGEFKSYLEKEKVSSNTIKNYLSDIKHLTTVVPILSTANPEIIKKYHEQVSHDFSPASAKRKSISVKKFLSWAKNQGLVNFEVEEKANPAKNAVKTPGNHRLNNWYRKYQSIPGVGYLNAVVILILFFALGFGVYNQFIKNAIQPLAYPSSLVRPNRYLSFQGRLTNNFGNPVASPTNVVFNLYSGSTGGPSLWNSGTCSITPDSDGVFSTLLGSDCGSELTSDIFSQNAAIWLGVTVSTDAEATPRVQIATVAYSLNSETLQGYPASSSATANTVPVVNNAGQIVLAVSSPKIQSTSGTFAIEGQAVTIDTPSGSNGNITLSPDGTGQVNLNFNGASPGSGTGMVNATDANLTSGSLYYGSVANNSTTYNLLQLQSGSSPTNKFVVDYAGDITAAGYASISGNLTLAGGARSIQTTSFNPLTIGGATTGNIILNPSNGVAGGNISPGVTDVTDLGSSSSLEFRNIYGKTLYQNGNQVCDSSGLISGCTSNFWQLNSKFSPLQTQLMI